MLLFLSNLVQLKVASEFIGGAPTPTYELSYSFLQPLDFSFQPSSDVLSFEFPFVTSVTALEFQFNLYLSEYSRPKYLCCIRIISIKKKIFTFPLLDLNFHCIS